MTDPEHTMTDAKQARLARVIAGIEMMDGTPGPRANTWPPNDNDAPVARVYGWRAIAVPILTWGVCALALYGALDIVRRLL